MPYRTRPRFEARIQRRENPPAPKAEGRWEPRQVLDALNEMHNAPRGERELVRGRPGGK
jgi:hypothetical protein